MVAHPTMHKDVYAELAAYFRQQGVAYREISHTPGCCRDEQQAKCLFLRVNQRGGSSYALCAIQAHKRANTQRIANLLGAKEVKIGTPDALYQITGCHVDELPPAASIFGLSLLMDSDLLYEDEIFLNAGRADVVFVIDPRELERIERPTFF